MYMHTQQAGTSSYPALGFPKVLKILHFSVQIMFAGNHQLRLSTSNPFFKCPRIQLVCTYMYDKIYIQYTHMYTLNH